MSTIASASPDRNSSPASLNCQSDLIKAPPPTRTNSPPPTPNLNSIDLSSGPPLCFDDVGVIEGHENDKASKVADDEKYLPSTPLATSTPFHSSASIPLVVISPPESNHGSPIVSPFVSPSSTSDPSSLPPLPSSSEDCESVADVDTTSDPSFSPILSSHHLSESWHPRSQADSTLNEEITPKCESAGEGQNVKEGGSSGGVLVVKNEAEEEGGGTSGSCYSLESAPQSGDNHEEQNGSLKQNKQDRGTEKGCQNRDRDKSLKRMTFIERLTRMFSASSKRGLSEK